VKRKALLLPLLLAAVDQPLIFFLPELLPNLYFFVIFAVEILKYDKLMVKKEDFFILSNEVNIAEEEYLKLDILIDTLDAISRTAYQSLYIIDYYKRNFLYVSDNPLFLCGHTAKEVRSLGYAFYIEHVPMEEQIILTEMNRVGFNFYTKIPVHERIKYTISYNFHLLNEKKKTLIHHKLTPVRLADDGKIWLAACVVSLASRNQIGYIEMHKIDDANYSKYLIEDGYWRKEKRVTLNEKEKRILSLSIQGYTMNEIADQICLSLEAIKFYRQKLFGKLDVKNITEAIAFATNHKLL
jgi:DNA-binding CsgD family transcriptional regulator